MGFWLSWRGRGSGFRLVLRGSRLMFGHVGQCRAGPGQIRLCHDDVRLWADVWSRYPSSLNSNLNLADALIRAGDPGSANPLCRTALRLSGADDGLTTICLAKALTGSGLLTEARPRLEHLVEKRPDWGAAHDLFGVTLAGLGEYSPALEQFRRAVALAPSSAQAQYNLGALLARQGRFSEAVPVLAAATRLEPDEPRFRAVLEQARHDLGQRASPHP